MQSIYFGTVFAAIFIFSLAVVVLFLQRKKGERARTILAGMTLLSVLNYVRILINFHTHPPYQGGSVMQVPFLLIGLFIVTIYITYPIEVISPGWITWKRLVKVYLPVIGLWLFYRLTLCLGIEYTAYPTIGAMMEDIGSFQVIFRIVLILLIFGPTLLLYYVPYTRRYNNTNYEWIRGYIAAITINMAAYLFVNIHDTYLVCSIYIIISILCSLYITYQELFVRLIRQSTALPTPPVQVTESVLNPNTNTYQPPKSRESDLFERLEKYMNSTLAWRDPDLSAEKITSALYSNRTSMLKAVQQQGYDGYSSYVNGKRVTEFIQMISQQQGEVNYQQTFFDVGFRSKSTALRNFKNITGMIPSEYFKKE